MHVIRDDGSLDSTLDPGLSLDHRIVDGHVGAEFAYDVIETLENPERLFYEYL